MTEKVDRRQALKAISGTAALAISTGLAGCSGSNGETQAATPSQTSTPTEASDGGGDGGGEWAQTKTVDMTDSLKFDPDHIRVSAGTKVTWENSSGIGHTVTAYEDEIPDGAEYFASGGFDSEQAARDGYPDKGNVTADGTYSHTFETKGTYKYFCIPHEMNGMVGYVKVV